MTGQPSSPPRPGAHRAPTRWPLRAAVLCAVVLVAVVAVVVLNRETPESPDGSGETMRPSRISWRGWRRSCRTTRRSCAPTGRAGRRRRGRRRCAFRPRTSEEADALLVVRGEPPTGSEVLARFGGPNADALTLVDPDPGRPTAEQLQRRQRLAAAILANPNTGATGRAADVLRSAGVDARLLGLLAALVAQLGTGIATSRRPPGEPADGPSPGTCSSTASGRRPSGRGGGDRPPRGVPAGPAAPVRPGRRRGHRRGRPRRFRYESSPDALVDENTP